MPSATVECSFHSGHPELASQYAGRYWAWTPEADGTDSDAVLHEVEAWLKYEVEKITDWEYRGEGWDEAATPNTEVLWDDDRGGLLEALWVCPAEDHDDENCSCYVERTEFRIDYGE